MLQPPAFADDPHVPGRRVWRKPNAGAWASGIAAVFFTALGGGMLLAVAAMIASKGLPPWWFIPLMASVAAFVEWLAWYCWRDARGKRGMRLMIEGSRLTLDLPAGRSLIHPTPACHETIDLDDLAAVEMRIEIYVAGVMAQCPYRLIRKNGPPIFLFEDRAVGTDMAEAAKYRIPAEIAVRADVPFRDCGEVIGQIGLLGIAFAKAPPWPPTAGVKKGRVVSSAATG